MSESQQGEASKPKPTGATARPISSTHARPVKVKFTSDSSANRAIYDPKTEKGSRKIIAAIREFRSRQKQGISLTEDEEDKLAWLNHIAALQEEEVERLKKVKEQQAEFARLREEKEKQERLAQGLKALAKFEALAEEKGEEAAAEEVFGKEDIFTKKQEEEQEVEGSPTPRPSPTGSRSPSPTHSRSRSQSPPGRTTSATGTTATTTVSTAAGGSGTGGGGGGGDPNPDSDDDDMAGRPKGNEINNIPMFDGTTPDPERWLDAVERVALTFDWADDRIGKAACLRMESKAALWLESLVRTDKMRDLTGGDYATFKRVFLARFKPLDEAIKATEAIMGLTMRSGESVTEFADRITIGIEKKNATWDDATKRTREYKANRQLDMFTFMCAGLDNSLRRVVMGGSDPPTNYADLLKKAVSAEAALKAKHSIQELVEGLEGADTNDQKETVDDPNAVKIAALEKQIEAMKDGIKCWHCAEVGHTKKFCPKFKQQQQSGGNRGRGGGRGRGGFQGRGGGYQGNWRGGFRGNRGGNWRGRGGGRGRGYTPQAYFGQPGYYQQGFQPRYPGVQQIQQGYGYAPQQQYPQQQQQQQPHQQYEIIEMPGNF